MKRTLLFVAMTVITGLSATAQCTPDPQYTSPGVYPDSATGFASACVGVAYEQLITNVVPVDTTVEVVPGFPVTLDFDSVVVTSVTGLPTGFTYSCYDGQNVTSPVDQCAFEGGTIGCISIVGTPQSGDEGSYTLVIEVDAYLQGGSTPQASYTVDYYVIDIFAAGACTSGINEATASKFNLFPNPVAESFTIDGLEGLDVTTISIVNAAGKVLNSFSDINTATFDMNVSDLEGGVYFVQIAHGASMDVVRFIKE